jgi:hypothetical protein
MVFFLSVTMIGPMIWKTRHVVMAPGYYPSRRAQAEMPGGGGVMKNVGRAVVERSMVTMVIVWGDQCFLLSLGSFNLR